MSVKTTTHKQMVRLAQNHLAGRVFSCPVVITELVTSRNYEIPDALGFNSSGRSILIECKVSRADFLADQKKTFRINESMGLGDARYFFAPAGIIAIDDLPKGWGLLELHGNSWIRRQKDSECFETNKEAEVQLLVSAIRRLKLSTAVFIQPEDNYTENFIEETND